MKASRLWCLTIAAVVFLIAQIFALNIQNPHYLSLVSGCTGVAYGFLFGCFPSLVAEAFGIHGLSTNWGTMTLSPVISGNVFNIFYGMVYDKHSIVKDGGERVCTEGLDCYRSAYKFTVVACVFGLLLNLWTIHHTHKSRRKEEKERELEHEA
jgi:MFS family permease